MLWFKLSKRRFTFRRRLGYAPLHLFPFCTIDSYCRGITWGWLRLHWEAWMS